MRSLVSDLGAVRRLMGGLALAGVLTLGMSGLAAAETATAGNGGSSSAGADGGSVSSGPVESDESAGSIDVTSLLGEDIAATVIASILGTDTVEAE